VLSDDPNKPKHVAAHGAVTVYSPLRLVLKAVLKGK